MKPADFEIGALETTEQNDDLRQDRLRHYELLWFKSSPGTIWIDSHPYEVKSNSIYYLQPGRLIRYKINNNVRGYSISFSSDFLYKSLLYTRITAWFDVYEIQQKTPVIETDDDMETEIEDIARKMQKEFFNTHKMRTEILAGLLNMLMIHLSGKIYADTTEISYSKELELVRKFKSLLKKNFVSMKLVADYANELYVTPNYLNRTVKKITGYTASYHIQQQIIIEAKIQAMHSDISMKEIAYLLGFDNLAHFSKFFKNNSGMSFTNFKKINCKVHHDHVRHDRYCPL